VLEDLGGAVEAARVHRQPEGHVGIHGVSPSSCSA
jgi:hypothetical protein